MVVEILLEQEDLDVNAEDEESQTPLHPATSSKSTAILIVLKPKSVNSNTQTASGQTIVHLLAKWTKIDPQ